ncbi:MULTISPECIES: IS3 family transposase [Flavobacterium]|uniref:IS3 family transposase n=1 Tax=Flavobacterium TaxID=237 RepID=UPI0009F69529
MTCRYKYKNRKQAGKSIHDYIENFFNTVRRHFALGNLTMEEFQSKYLISKKQTYKP